MKKIAMLSLIAVGLIALTACGSKYDDEIDQVLELENEVLNDSGTKTDIDTLKRDDTQIWVYNDGEYIELKYVIRGKSQTSNPLYKYNEDKERYEDYIDGDFHSGDADNLEPDYTENVDDDS